MIKALVVGPHWFGGLTESSAHALKQCNCEVEVFYFNKVIEHEFLGNTGNTSIRQGLKKFASSLGLEPTLLIRQLFWAVMMSQEIDKRLIALAEKFMPDLVLVLKGEMVLPKTLRKLKELSSKPFLANWWVDNPIYQDDKHKWLIFPRCVPHYDHLFIFDRSYFQALEDLGARKISFLPCAADSKNYYPVSLSVGQSSQLACNVCFIASYYPARGELIAPFLDVPGLAIWGGGWTDFLERKGVRDVHRIVRGQYLQIEDVNKAYQAARFVLNSHHPQSKRGGLNSRAFEIAASGGAQLMDYIPEMEELLVPGEEVIVYRSPQEGADLARELVKNHAIRDRIAKAGHERVMAEHTYKHRMRTILDMM